MNVKLPCLISLFLTSFITFGKEPINVPIEKLGADFELIGKLQSPLGTMIKVAGVVVEGDHKGYEDGLNLRVQRIQGRYHQDHIQIVIETSLLEGDEESDGNEAAISELRVGKTYEMEGYETGGFVGIPSEALERMKSIPQTCSHYFRHLFVPIKAKPIEPISYSPWMFSNEKALLNGIAKSIKGDSVLVGDDWSVVIRRGGKWADDLEGKKMESYGLYKPDPAEENSSNTTVKKFDLVDGWCRLVALEDQIGKKVCLRGMAQSMNDSWWFHYRGTDLDVEDMDKLAGWTVDNHWRPMEIEGRLELVKPPSTGQSSDKHDSASSNKFIIRDPSWKPLPALLAPERAFPAQAEEKSEGEPFK